MHYNRKEGKEKERMKQGKEDREEKKKGRN